MNKKHGRILFIVEGEVRELDIIDNIKQVHFKNKKPTDIVPLSAKQNLYMLWNTLKTDEFETDIVEILRENVYGAAKILNGLTSDDFDEIFLFFDYDSQQNNLKKADISEDILAGLLEFFNNETEYGKLYISYPMVEALRDFQVAKCNVYSSCIIDYDVLPKYKELSGDKNPNSDFRHYTIDIWKNIFEVFSMRLSCLFNLKNTFDFAQYHKIVSPSSVYEKQSQQYISQNKIFVLSAFPHFLLDYFSLKFWKTMIKRKSRIYTFCKKLQN